MNFFKQLITISIAFSPLTALALSSESLNETITSNYDKVADFAGFKGPGSENLHPLDIFGFYFAVTVGFVGVLFVVQVIHGGFMWMTAGGNEEKISQAMKKITNGAIGAAIIVFSYILATFLLRMIGQYSGVDTGFQPE